MRRRVPLLSLLALLILTGSAFAAAAAPSPSYVYTGRSTQGIAVRLATESAGHTRWFRYRATMTCNDGSTFTDDYFSDDVTITPEHTFSDAYTSNAGAITTKVTGSLSGRHASGTIRIIERFSELAVDGTTPLSASGAIICDSHTVRWTATARLP